jgi:hypothetical protein
MVTIAISIRQPVSKELYLFRERLSPEDESVSDGWRCRMDKEKLLVDFYNGAHFLERVAAWAYVVANHQMVLEQGIAFEKAYEQLIELHAAGKLGVGAADMSAENLDRIKRIIRLIQPELDSGEARRAAQEIHALAEGCVQALTRGGSSPVEQGS